LDGFRDSSREAGSIPAVEAGHDPARPDAASAAGTAAAVPEAGAASPLHGRRLRAWQREALARFEASDAPSFLVVATPGAGKTTFALTAVRRALVARRARRFVVVVPTQHLKAQWAHAAEQMDLHLDPGWSAGYGALPSDVHGVVVTYQQVAANPGALRQLVHGAVAVLDEIHHAGESRAWGDAVRVAFANAARRLALSGTPFRSDQNMIPFVRYDGDLAEADYEYGYGEALKDRAVVRPVYFPRIKGHMEWTAPGGLDYAATFDDPLTRELANQRLRTALDAEGEWLPAVLAQADAQLRHLRAGDPRAAGLVIAMDQDHARGIAAIMRERTGAAPVIATSDEPAASEKISGFAEGSAPWIVAVRMVSEGVDIPRLRVGVYATNTVTDLFFRQAVGRLVRWAGGAGRQTAYMFIPDDARLRTFAGGIAEQRRHSLRKPEAPPEGDEGEGRRRRDDGGADGEAPEAAAEEGGQLSLFTAISAVPLGEDGRPLDGMRLYPDDGGADAIPDLVPDVAPEPIDGARRRPPPLILEASGGRAPVPLPDPEPSGAAGAGPQAQAKISALARRRELREQNSAAVTDLVHSTGKSHATINADLNRRAGIRRISEATVRQLERRLELAKGMQRRL
jgi:superfamily II DNA or RNA helicase